jgi:hypothetical protein
MKKVLRRFQGYKAALLSGNQEQRYCSFIYRSTSSCDNGLPSTCIRLKVRCRVTNCGFFFDSQLALSQFLVDLEAFELGLHKHQLIHDMNQREIEHFKKEKQRIGVLKLYLSNS